MQHIFISWILFLHISTHFLHISSYFHIFPSPDNSRRVWWCKNFRFTYRLKFWGGLRKDMKHIQIFRPATYPSTWKTLIVIPIYKSNSDPSNPQSNKQISLISVLGKLFEKNIWANSRVLHPHGSRISSSLRIKNKDHVSCPLQFI